jgi:hypothetical protein
LVFTDDSDSTGTFPARHNVVNKSLFGNRGDRGAWVIGIKGERGHINERNLLGLYNKQKLVSIGFQG